MFYSPIRKFFILFSLLCAFQKASTGAAIELEVVYPKEGDEIIASDTTFVFGNISSENGRVYVNHKRAKVYPNGSFLVTVPVKPGVFIFDCVATLEGDTAQVTRSVYIPYFLKTSSSYPLTMDTSYVFPREDWTLQPGDVFRVAFKGSPGCYATFSIDGLVEKLPMAELSPQQSYYWGESFFNQGTNFQMSEVEGIYTGAYIIQSLDWAMNRSVSFELVDIYGDTSSATAKGRLSIDNTAIPQIAKVIKDVKVAQNGSRIGSQLFLAAGVRVWVVGKRGKYLKVRLSEVNEIWIRNENIEMLPPGTPLPEGIITEINVEAIERKNRVKISLDQILPFKVEQRSDPTSLLVTFFGASANVDMIKLEYGDNLVRDIRWEQVTSSELQISIQLNQEYHWGYNPYYKDGIFVIDIKNSPEISGWPSSPLKNILICLDPGHSPDLGAVGPTGTAEKDINYKYCVALKEILEEKGAQVVLTRGEKDGISLDGRTKLAALVDADILLSIHFNAFPDGVDPFRIRGISTYYYHPQSYRLAKLIQEMLLKYTGAHDFGLFNNNLALCRPTQMISVLTEPGFLIHPWEEILIKSESYQNKVVNSIVKALEQFLKESK